MSRKVYLVIVCALAPAGAGALTYMIYPAGVPHRYGAMLAVAGTVAVVGGVICDKGRALAWPIKLLARLFSRALDLLTARALEASLRRSKVLRPFVEDLDQRVADFMAVTRARREKKRNEEQAWWDSLTEAEKNRREMRHLKDRIEQLETKQRETQSVTTTIEEARESIGSLLTVVGAVLLLLAALQGFIGT